MSITLGVFEVGVAAMPSHVVQECVVFHGTITISFWASGGKAKPYQVKQLIRIIDSYDLRPLEGE